MLTLYWKYENNFLLSWQCQQVVDVLIAQPLNFTQQPNGINAKKTNNVLCVNDPVNCLIFTNYSKI